MLFHFMQGLTVWMICMSSKDSTIDGCDRVLVAVGDSGYVQTSLKMEYSGASKCGICLMSSWSRSIDHAALTVREGAISRGISAREPLRKYFVQIAIVFLAYVVAGKLGQATTNIRSSNLGPVWPAYGIAVAAILICGYRVSLGVAAGAFFVAFFSPVPHLAAVGQAAGATLAAVGAAFLLHHVDDFRASLSRLSDVLGLIVFGAWGSALVSASIGVSVLYATHVHAYSGLGAAWLIYWLGNATGVLLVTPLALTLANFLNLRDRHRIAELAVLLLLLTATCVIVFTDLPLIPVKLHFMAFAVLPFIIWATIHFGMSGATLSVFMVATVATVATAYGSGPFSQDTPFENAVLLDVFFAVLSVSGMTLAAVIAERERHLHDKAAMDTRLQDERAVRESEERLRLAIQIGQMYAYEWDVSTDVVVRSPQYMNILGLSGEPLRLTRQQLLERVHPEDRAKFSAAIATLTPESPHTQVSYRVLRPDGSIVWLEKNARAFFDENGKMLRMIGVVADVTERKLAEDALSNVSRRLVQAQEQERSRIARELHDDVGQRLALLAIQLEELREKLDSVPEPRTRIGELQKETVEISITIQAMSHELHSSKLEYLGLVAAMRIFCKEFGERQNVEVDFKSYDVPRSLPPELSLSLFRVLQEALHNAAKHSGTKHVDVQLWVTSGKVNLTVSDLGLGFNTEATMHGTGLGLTSMRERMRLLGGELSINSEPRRGTTIHARVPFDSSSDSAEGTG
jgi:PAS domain S-box-containing protein